MLFQGMKESQTLINQKWHGCLKSNSFCAQKNIYETENFSKKRLKNTPESKFTYYPVQNGANSMLEKIFMELTVFFQNRLKTL